MKKVMAILVLITALGISTPAFAAPPAQAPNHRGHSIHTAPHHHRPMMSTPGHYYGPHGGIVIRTGFSSNRHFYNHRIGYPYCRCPYCMAHRPIQGHGIGFYIGL